MQGCPRPVQGPQSTLHPKAAKAKVVAGAARRAQLARVPAHHGGGRAPCAHTCKLHSEHRRRGGRAGPSSAEGGDPGPALPRGCRARPAPA